MSAGLQPALSDLARTLFTCSQSISTCRLVGLLLVTRLLPAGDEAAILSVHQALGMAFLQRLLLPLTGQQARPL